MAIIIREEQAWDISAIFELTKAAFAHHPFGNHTEQFVTDALRAAGALALSLVAEVDGEIAGHVAFSRVSISDGAQDWYGLGPIAVRPDRQRQGIGSALIHDGLARIKALGAAGCILLGSAAYYGRFGFANDSALTLEGVPQEYFLALPFAESRAEGSVTYHEAFLAES